MKRSLDRNRRRWVRFAMILMEDCDPVEVVKSIWPEGRIEQ